MDIVCTYSTFKVSLRGKIMTRSNSGHVRLSIRYAKALPETINVLVYAKFPELVTIDHTGSVNLS